MPDDVRICLDLFCGLGGFSAAFEDADGWEVYTVDIEERFDPDLQADVLDLRPVDLLELIGLDRGEIYALVVLASPPCTVLSMANQPNPHWDGDTPVSEESREAISLTYHALGLIQSLDPDYWYLENPRQGKMSTVLGPPTGHVTYCQYGYEWQKPTDLWGKHAPMEYKTCPPGRGCHQPSEGGWDTGEKRKHVRDPAERSLVPRELSNSILESCNSVLDGTVRKQSTVHDY